MRLFGASRAHARLTPVGGGWTVADAGSSNGTSVNGQRIAAHRVLRPGDEITVGDAVFRLETTAHEVPLDRPTVLTPRGIDAPPVLNVTIAGGGPVGCRWR